MAGTRTCIACRRRAKVAELLGLCIVEGGAQLTRIAGIRSGVEQIPGGAQVGRGKYACPDRKCVDRALRQLLRGGRQKDVAGDNRPEAALLREAIEWLQKAIPLRRQGLERRRIDSAADARLRAWRELAERMSTSLTGAATTHRAGGERRV